jgi:multiple sugar transport system substrate-binding protein
MRGPTLLGITWDHPRGLDPLVAASAEYEARTGIAVRWQVRSLQQFGDQPLVNPAHESDLLVIDHPHIGVAAAKGLLLDLASTRQSAEIVRVSNAVGQSFESYRLGSRQFGVAIDAAAQVIAWRPDRLPGPPADWSEIERLAQRGDVVWPLKPVDAFSSFCSLSASAGGFDHGVETRFVDPLIGEEVLALMRRIAGDLDADCLAMDPPAALEALSTSDRFAMAPLVFGYSNYAREGFRPHRVAFADFVGLRGGHAGSLLGGAGLAVTLRTAYPEEAAAFALWVASDDVQCSVYVRSGGQPASRAAWSDPEANALTGDFFTSTRTTLDGAWLRPRHAWYPDFQLRAEDVITGVLRGGPNPAQAVTELNAAWDQHRIAGQATT